MALQVRRRAGLPEGLPLRAFEEVKPTPRPRLDPIAVDKTLSTHPDIQDGDIIILEQALSEVRFLCFASSVQLGPNAPQQWADRNSKQLHVPCSAVYRWVRTILTSYQAAVSPAYKHCVSGSLGMQYVLTELLCRRCKSAYAGIVRELCRQSPGSWRARRSPTSWSTC